MKQGREGDDTNTILHLTLVSVRFLAVQYRPAKHLLSTSNECGTVCLQRADAHLALQVWT